MLDFGLVKQIESDQWSAELARTNQISGSLSYLAPERIRNPQIADQRTDLYAVGVVAYFLRTEKNPFSPQTELDGIHQILAEEAGPFSAAPIADIPQELEQLITRCLAKDMDDRPSDADEMIRVFDHLQETNTWTETDAQAWWSGRFPTENRDS